MRGDAFAKRPCRTHYRFTYTSFPVRYVAFGPPSRPTQHQVAVFPHLGTGSKSWQRYEAPQVTGAVAIAIDSARTPVTESRPGPKPELVDPSSRFSEQVNGAFRPIAYTLTQGVRKAEQRRRCPWTHPTTKARRGISFRAYRCRSSIQRDSKNF